MRSIAYICARSACSAIDDHDQPRPPDRNSSYQIAETESQVRDHLLENLGFVIDYSYQEAEISRDSLLAGTIQIPGEAELHYSGDCNSAAVLQAPARESTESEQPEL